jgi:hypothetical protein
MLCSARFAYSSVLPAHSFNIHLSMMRFRVGLIKLAVSLQTSSDFKLMMLKAHWDNADLLSNNRNWLNRLDEKGSTFRFSDILKIIHLDSELLDLWNPQSGIRKTRNQSGSETGSASVLRWEEEFTQWLELALSEVPNGAGVSLHSSEDGERPSFRNVYISVWNSGQWTKSINPEILSVIRHRQNPLNSTRTFETHYISRQFSLQLMAHTLYKPCFQKIPHT